MFLALAISILPLAYWFHIDHLYPRNDSGQYFFVAQTLYLGFKKWGMLHAIQQAYLYRASKPVLESALELPFIMIAGGKVLWARGLFGLFFYSVFGSYIYLILRKYLSRASTVLLAGVLTSLPWIYHSSIAGLPEMPFLALVSAAIYHLLSSEKLSLRRHATCFCVFAGLAICARPVEGTLCFIIPLLSLLEGTREWLSALALASSAGLALVAELHTVPRGPDWVHGFPIVVAGLAVFAVLSGKARHERRAPLLTIATVYCIPALWFTPFLRDVYSWLVSANFSQISAITGRRSGWSAVDFLWSIPVRIGGNLFFALVLLSVAVYLLSARNRFKEALIQGSRSFLTKLLFGMIVLLPLLGAVTNNGDPRYYYSGMIALLAVLGVYLLKAPIRKVAVTLLAVFWCVQLGYFSAAQVGPTWLTSVNWIALYRPQKLWPYTVWAFNPTAVDPAIQPLSEILAQMKSGRPTAKVAILQLDAPDFDHYALGPWEYTIMARERGLSDLFEMPWPCGFADQRKDVAVISSSYDYLIVGPVSGTANPATPAAPLARYIVQHYQDGRLDALGLRLLGLVRTGADSRSNLLLLQSLHSDRPQMTCSG